MRLLATLVLALGVAVPQLRADQGQPPTDQIKRGQELFLKSPKGIACGTCHSMAGLGTAVGPDLSTIAKYAMPRGLVMAIRMNSTENIQAVTQEGAKPFPARVVEKKDGVYTLWNLSQMPPVKLTVPEKQVVSITRDQKWQHPPAAAGYTANELADLIGFLKWAAGGGQKPVTLEDIGDVE